MLFQVLTEPDLRFCSQVLALSFNEKGKSFNLIMFMLQFWFMYYKLPQNLLDANMNFYILNHEMLVKVG